MDESQRGKMKLITLLLTLICATIAPSTPKDYPPKTMPGANGPTETVRK